MPIGTSWANVGSELNKMAPDSGLGTAPDFSEVGFWGGGGALSNVLEKYMKDIEAQRQWNAMQNINAMNSGANFDSHLLEALTKIPAAQIAAGATVEGQRVGHQASADALLQAKAMGERGATQREGMKEAGLDRRAKMQLEVAKQINPDMWSKLITQAGNENPNATPYEKSVRALQMWRELRGVNNLGSDAGAPIAPPVNATPPPKQPGLLSRAYNYFDDIKGDFDPIEFTRAIMSLPGYNNLLRYTEGAREAAKLKGQQLKESWSE